MNKYLKDGLESLKDISEGAVPPEVFCLSAKAILEHINNLQSKIDKAIEILNDGLKQLDERNRCEVYSEEYLENARDILKEDK